MQFHQLSAKTKFRKSRRVGRGGKRGTYSGRGIKGQRARAGARIRPAERDILKKIPKLRGYKFKSFRLKPAVINFSRIAKKFKSGDLVSPESLLKAGLLSRIKGRVPEIKILGGGDMTKKLQFKGVTFSASAQKKLSAKNA
ncbi:MAG: uL15 family ribosomal protein [Candidatus Sungbacteria bacterium]|nr:uL15 family ribosomal protein [Candidatus Sungbacteria bacterium]